MKKVDRRTFIKTGISFVGGVTAANLFQGRDVAAIPDTMQQAHAESASGRPNNILVIITDQQRSAQHWPDGLAEALQPSLARLKKNGLTFTNAFTATSQCAPSRCTTFTGTYPTIHGVEETPPNPGLRQEQLNLCSMLNDTHTVAYKGKWHMTLPFSSYPGDVTPTDETARTVNEFIWGYYDSYFLENNYGVKGWNPPDAGNSLSLVPFIGGGYPNNDRRYVRGFDRVADTRMLPGIGESAIDFLDRFDSAADKPFFLIVSLVNPHDVGLYPNDTLEAWGFFEKDYRDIGVDLPPNFDDKLNKKPKVQRMIRQLFDQEQPLPTFEQQLNYVRFYAHLHKIVDLEITALLDKLDEKNLTNDTLVIRYADHGEMGLSHGLREKMYTAYEETIHIPMVFSNPVMFPEPETSNALVSSIDLLPTIADWAGVAESIDFEANHIHGYSLCPILNGEQASVRDAVLFTYDDSYYIDHDKYPGRIRCIRKDDWKYCVYYTTKGKHRQYEMYNLNDDPWEMENLGKGNHGSANREMKQDLHEELTHLMDHYEATPNTFDWH